MRLKNIQIIWEMQNEKVSKKIKSSYLVIAIFSKKHSNSKETEMRDSSTWHPDWRALYAATIWEQSILCLVHSTRCRPGLTQTDIPLQQLLCTSGQGAGPRFGWNKPIYLYSRCYKSCLCIVTSLYIRVELTATSRLTSQWEIILKTLLTCR